jgi:manganese transport protein
MSEILGVSEETKPNVMRWVALSVILIGAALSLTGIRPVTIILSAQFANGILLPVIAGFLLYAMNQEKLLGKHVNKIAANVAGVAVLVIAAGLGARSVLGALGAI